MDPQQVKIIEQLENYYRGSTSSLVFHNPFELLIATILSAQSTDVQVNKITKKLFARYPTPDKIAALTEEELAEEIRGCGLYRTKAKNILAAVRILLFEHQGQVPPNREMLMDLPGVGRKTANVVLANAFSIPALAVDTHVFRVAHRLGLASGKTPEAVEEELTRLIPQEKWAEAHHWLIWHGRKICRAKKPLCGSCPLRGECPDYIRGSLKNV